MEITLKLYESIGCKLMPETEKNTLKFGLEQLEIKEDKS